jgi:hypothetical protein
VIPANAPTMYAAVISWTSTKDDRTPDDVSYTVGIVVGWQPIDEGRDPDADGELRSEPIIVNARDDYHPVHGQIYSGYATTPPPILDQVGDEVHHARVTIHLDLEEARLYGQGQVAALKAPRA